MFHKIFYNEPYYLLLGISGVNRKKFKMKQLFL